MGLSVFVGGKEFPLSSAEWYNRFRDYLAERGDCPRMMRFVPGRNIIHMFQDDEEAGTVSVVTLSDEIGNVVFDDKAPDYAKEIAGGYQNAMTYLLDSGRFDTIQ
jgi:hypothetical protein